MTDQSPDNPPRPRRRWWQHLCRWTLRALLVLTAAYITLPWWAPAGALCNFLQRRLTQQVGLDVQIQRMHLSWSNGVRLEKLTIASPDGFGSGPLATIESISTELAPLKLLLGRGPAYMQIKRPAFDIRSDAQGNLNIATLAKADLGPQAQQLTIDDAAVTFTLSPADAASQPDAAPVSLLLHVGNAQILAGAIERVQRVSMTAFLKQAEGDAPLDMTLSAQGAASSLASAALSFSKVQLGGLGLPVLLGLPLSDLQGACSGSLSVHINDQYVVDTFDLDLSVASLRLLPISGPHLPVIDKARLAIAGKCDPVLGELHLESIQARLPGLDLAGKAVVLLDPRAMEMGEIKSAHLTGKLHSGELSAMLQGDPLPLGLSFSEPIDFSLDVQHSGPRVGLSAVLDATRVAIGRDSHSVKDGGVPLRLELDGAVDDRQLSLALEHSSLTWGGNSLTMNLSLDGLSRISQQLASSSGQLPLKSALDMLGQLRTSGTITIKDMPSLLPVLMLAVPALREEPLMLDGAIEGSFSFNADGRGRLGATLSAGPQSRLTGLIVKPSGESAGVTVDGIIDADKLMMRDLNVELLLGAGVSRVDGELHLTSGTAMTFEGQGQIYADHIESLPLALGAPTFAGTVLGRATGQWMLAQDASGRRLHVSADLTHTGIVEPSLYVKGPGEPLNLELDLLTDRAPGGQTQATLSAQFPAAQAQCTITAAAAGQQGAQLHGSLGVTDAQWLLRASPALQQRLGQGHLEGAMGASWDATWDGREGAIKLRVEGDDLDLTMAQRRKSRGEPLRLDLQGRLCPGAEGAIDLTISDLELQVCNNRLGGSLTLLLDAQPATNATEASVVATPLADTRKVWPPPALREARGRLWGYLSLDEPTLAVLPELRPWATEHGAAGSVQVQTQLRYDAQGISLLASADAGRLSLATPHLIKPDGMPAGAELELTVAPDLSQVRVNQLDITAGSCGLTAGGSCNLSLDERGLPVELGALAGHASVWTSDAASLGLLSPDLASAGLSGQAMLELEVVDDGQALRLPYVIFHAQGLQGTHNAKRCGLSGEITAQQITSMASDQAGATFAQRARQLADALPQIETLSSDGLEFFVGENRGWLVLDVANLPLRATGRLPGGYALELMADNLYDRDLTEWLRPPAPTAPAALRTDEAQALVTQADATIAKLRPFAKDAALKVHASVRQLRTWDYAIDQAITIDQARLEASLQNGWAQVEFSGGLSGGNYRSHPSVNLMEDQPVVHYETQINGAMASSVMQAQLSASFPGNTLYGSLSQQETRQIPLRDYLAKSSDGRYRTMAHGTTKTVVIDGLLEGRAAPQFIANIFPGLNWAKYRYSRMTSFTDYHAQGWAHSDMVFSGAKYDTYIEGDTAADATASYGMGLILLGGPQSHEGNHATGLGRLPILKFKGRIEDGKMLDQSVYYPRPDEVVARILLHPVYKAWKSARK